jgi:ABC-type multidrug transport system fused ATPase/permease subunit
VDAEAEYLIQQALDEVLKGRRTALVIAHRLSTIRYADKIIALEGGRIREVGDHHELLSRGGLYRWQNGVALLLQDCVRTTTKTKAGR